MPLFGKKKKQEEPPPPAPAPARPSVTIGAPKNVKHTHHVELDDSSPLGLSGIPARWEGLLKRSGLTKEEIQQHKDDVVCLLQTYEQGPQQPTLPSLPLKKTYPLEELLSKEDPMDVYSDLHKLDQGSSGEVYRAYRTSDQQEVALKKIYIRQVAKDLASLENEISVMHSAHHPNIVNFFACHKKDNELWIAMELMSGGKLTDLIDFRAKEGFTEPQIACFCEHILKGMAYLHDNCRIHRDIKSDNILINSKGQIKLGDFGFCAAIVDGAKRTTVVGTPYWMSPEVIKGLSYDFKADIWSLGVLALELADGQPPLLDLAPMRAIYIIATQPPPQPKHPQKWSANFLDFCKQMLQKDPEHRPTAQALLKHPFLKQSCDPSFIPTMLAAMA